MSVSLSSSGVTIYQALPYVESAAPNSLNSTASTHIHLPFLLMVYLPVLALGKMSKPASETKEYKRSRPNKARNLLFTL